MFVQSEDLLVAAVRLGVPGRNATWAIGFGCGSINASSAPTAYIPGQKVEVPIKVCLGTKLGPLFVLTHATLIETPDV